MRGFIDLVGQLWDRALYMDITGWILFILVAKS